MSFVVAASLGGVVMPSLLDQADKQIAHCARTRPEAPIVMRVVSSRKVKLGMNSMVTIMLVLAGISGLAAQASGALGRFHGAVGSIALLGLFIHSVKHLSWMFSTSKKLFTGSGQQKANWPA
jgi:hypothetical protein